MVSLQQVILRLQTYWDRQGCALLQPYDMEVGAGTSHTATFLRALGPEPWRAAYVQPSRRPKDGRYGENPNRLQHYYQYQVVLKPSPLDILDRYIGSLHALGIDPREHDIRFVEDDWENPTLGAWGLGWEVWLNGMEVTQFTYFQQVGGLDCRPITGEITYGIERLAMYLQGVENVFDLVWTTWEEHGRTRTLTYGDVFKQNEIEQSTYNFEHSDTAILFAHFNDYEAQAKRLMGAELALPAYEMVLKAAHTFNLLDARGAISVTERASFIGRIRNLARAVAQAYYDSRERMGFPMLQQRAEVREAATAAPPVSTVAAGMTSARAPLLVELFTEELPPKSLERLGAAFASTLQQSLAAQGLVDGNATRTTYATPRRLAVRIDEVLALAPDRRETKKLMPAKVAFDAAGEATAALFKRLEKEGLEPEAMRHVERRMEGGAEYAFVQQTVRGATLQQGLQAALGAAIDALPIPRVMTYQLADGKTEVKFVRPAHGLMALHGAHVVPVAALGLTAGNTTHGHRFLGAAHIALAHADDYEARLEREGKVIASFARRREAIVAALEREAAVVGADARLAERAALLDEVTALVEWPAVYIAQFEPEFLAVPSECLILTMQANQKYFPLFDSAGKLTHCFLVVSNMALSNPRNVIEGNERVVRPRLADARFFFEQDKKTPLAERLPKLAAVVYHNKLGTQWERTQRVSRLAGAIAPLLGAPQALAQRAGMLAKADLLTDMVGEFPELQGTMGRYYALHDGEETLVADAIEQHYRPRYAGDALPDAGVPTALALADKLETLVGLFSIGAQPTGDKDPFGLRRAALGIIRMLIEGGLDVGLSTLLDPAFASFDTASRTAQDELVSFILERLRSYLRDAGYSANEIEAVLCLRPESLAVVPRQLAAVRAFARLPEAPSLAAANKRVVNILRQAQAKGEIAGTCNAHALAEPAERALLDALQSASAHATPLFEQGDYTAYLQTFAVLKSPVDAFFDSVMVMVDDPDLRHNRLALLADLRREMNRVADISKLAA